MQLDNIAPITRTADNGSRLTKWSESQVTKCSLWLENSCQSWVAALTPSITLYIITSHSLRIPFCTVCTNRTTFLVYVFQHGGAPIRACGGLPLTRADGLLNDSEDGEWHDASPSSLCPVIAQTDPRALAALHWDGSSHDSAPFNWETVWLRL